MDDCLFFGRDEKKIQEMIQRLKDDGFELTEEASVHAFLGIDVKEDDDGRLLLSQPGLIKKILRNTGMDMCAAKATPATQQPLGTNPKGKSREESWSYASVIGMLLYVASNTRPDIQFAVHQCARFTHTPKRSHEEAVKRICRYLKGTMDKGMIIDPKGSMKLNCYVDADFAGLWGHEDDQDPVCVKSRTGYVITLGACPLLWVSKLQTEIALSTMEAEYIALSQSMRDLLPIKRLVECVADALDLQKSDDVRAISTVFEARQ